MIYRVAVIYKGRGDNKKDRAIEAAAGTQCTGSSEEEFDGDLSNDMWFDCATKDAADELANRVLLSVTDVEIDRDEEGKDRSEMN